MNLATFSTTTLATEKDPAMACPACAPRYCAPSRCYCGHRECDAFATFVAHTKVSKSGPIYDDTVVATAPVVSDSSWDDRESDTWIDNL